MPSYGNFNLNKKNTKRKVIITAIFIAAVLFVLIYCLGLAVGSGSERTERISAAVAENTQLKEKVSELYAEVDRLQAEINDLNAQLEARPEVIVTEEISPSPEPAANELISPRNGL